MKLGVRRYGVGRTYHKQVDGWIYICIYQQSITHGVQLVSIRAKICTDVHIEF